MVSVNAGGQQCVVDHDLRRDMNHDLRPLSSILYERVKQKLSVLHYFHVDTNTHSSQQFLQLYQQTLLQIVIGAR